MNQAIEAALGFISKLVDVDVLRQGVIEVALGLALHLDAAHSTQAFNFYRYERSNAACSANLINEVDFRVPVNKNKGDELLYITLEPTHWLNASVVIERYGQPLKVVASSPQESRGTGVAVTYVYLLGKRNVSFSFSPSPQETLLSIALERHR